MFEIIRNLEKVSPRKGKNEKKAAGIIKNALRGFEIYEQKFRNILPNGRAKLEVDGKEIKCEATSFVSGKIKEKALISSIHISARIFSSTNINFNPYCRTISLATFYYAPSLAIPRNDVKRIIDAEEINGVVKVRKEKFVTENIIIGNLENPKCIVFTHYDSIKKGAIDNSSGVSVIVDTIKENSTLLRNSIFVFSGSEELSFDKPIYWGKGYRVFEEEFKALLENAKRIFVVDCAGFDEPIFTKKFLTEAIPLKNLEKWNKKTYLLTSDNIRRLWNIYHSDLDKITLLRKNHLKKTKIMITKALKQ